MRKILKDLRSTAEFELEAGETAADDAEYAQVSRTIHWCGGLNSSQSPTNWLSNYKIDCKY